MVILLIISCNNVDDVVNTTTQNSVDVYVAGEKNGQPCYWKNNQLVMLDIGNYIGLKVREIIVSNDNVYILGESMYSTNVNGYSYVLWKNGVLINLNTLLSTNADYTAFIGDMDVIGDDLYFVGCTTSTAITPNFSPKLVTWKNNVKTILSENILDWNGASIKVKNNVVYTTSTPEQGYYIDTTFHLKNGYDLSGFAFNNNNTFVYGTKTDNNNNPEFGYYENITTGIETLLSSLNSVSLLQYDLNNEYFENNDKIYKNSSLIYTVPLATNDIFDFKVLNNNLYTIEGLNVNNTPLVVKINNVISMTSQSDEVFNSLFIYQN